MLLNAAVLIIFKFSPYYSQKTNNNLKSKHNGGT